QSLSAFDNSPTSLSGALSLHDALPIYILVVHLDRTFQFRNALNTTQGFALAETNQRHALGVAAQQADLINAGTHQRALVGNQHQDRKSTRLNSSHVKISYAVFCLKKK